MKQALLNQKNHEETQQHFYHLNMTENNNIEEDAYFIYRIISYKKKCCEF